MNVRARLFLAAVTAALVGCASTPSLPEAPWSRRTLDPAEVPPVYRLQWEKAENRSTCALVAPASLGQHTNARARAATFSGGWAVAYDTAETRSAFGVAGTGASATDGTYVWPYSKRWADGSEAGYGPEGGAGPNELAYLRIPGQQCLYNVWSRLGRDHLEWLLEELRFVGTE